MWLDDLGDRVLRGESVSRDEALAAARLAGADRYDAIAWADRIRRHFLGQTVDLCSIVNARCGRCSEDCIFCSQSERYGTGIETWPMKSADEIVGAARSAESAGAKCFGIVTSGRGPRGSELPTVLDAVAAIRTTTKLEVAASLGELSADDARRLKVAGLVRYHHNIETSRRHFGRICTTHSYDDRLRTVRAARQAGLEVCCGGIIGLGETMEDRVDMALELRSLGVTSVPLNVLMPVLGTPAAAFSPLRPLEVLHTIALFRLVLPAAHIKMAGGRETSLGALQSLVFMAGASGIMVGDYLTRKGTSPSADMLMIEALELQLPADDR